MFRIITALLLTLSLLGTGCASRTIYIYPPENGGKRMPAEVLEEQEKSVWLGVLLTIFPGILWHGIGHRYAGDTKKARQIEQFEAISLLGLGMGTGLFFGALEARDEDLTGLEISLYISGGTLGGLGALGFVGTWLYDIIYTPQAIKKFNRNLYMPDTEEDEDDFWSF